jgi:hypothetical protein
MPIPEPPVPPAPRWGDAPDPAQVDDLIRRAERHPLGLPFLLRGQHDSVAATFQVHAFVVDEARARLGTSFPIRT